MINFTVNRLAQIIPSNDKFSFKEAPNIRLESDKVCPVYNPMTESQEKN